VLSNHQSSGEHSAWLVYGLLFVIVVGALAIRFRLRDMPLERDEGEYAYAGQLLLQGAGPYQHLYSVKLPGTYAVYALVLATLGQSAAAIHIGLALANTIGIVCLFFISRKLWDDWAAIVAAATYALLSLGAPVNGLAAHATQFVVLFAMLGTWMLLAATDSPKPILLFCTGVLFGLAFLMKQPGLLFFLWALGYYVYQRRRSNSAHALPSDIAVLIGGAVLPFVITCLLMAATGEFGKFWFWTFTYVRHYGTEVPLADGLALLGLQGWQIVRVAPLLWVIALVGLSAAAWNARARVTGFFTTSLLVASFIATSAGLYFRPHYFILLLPAVSLLAGVAVACATAKLPPTLRPLPALVFAIAVAHALYLQREVLFRMSPIEACEQIYPHQPFAAAVEVATYIRAHTSEHDTIAVLGSEPEIYFYAHRRAATGYVYMYPLLKPQAYSDQAQSEMIREVEVARPAMLVFVNVPASWIASAHTEANPELLQWARNYIAANYVADGVAEFDTSPQYIWGEQAAHYSVHSPFNMLVFRRKQP